MTVIRPNSITGINSITAQGSTVEFYDPDGDTITIQANVSGNLEVVSGILTATTVDATTVKVGTGVTISAGVITATSFSGDGSGLSGIDASSLKSGGVVKVQANSSGAIISGVATATQITVGNAYIKDSAVGLGTTTSSGRDAGISTAVGSMIYIPDVGLQVYSGSDQGWKSVADTSGGALTGMIATGGVINEYTVGTDVYRAHIFTSSGTFDVTALSTNPSLPDAVEYVVVGGGGGGGGAGGSNTASAGGGGAGGFRTNAPGGSGGGGSSEAAFPVSVASYTVTVGGG